MVITALQGMEAGAERTAAANDLLGKSAVDMAAVLNTGEEESERLKQEALEERMLEELLLAKRPEPKYSITQVVEKAKDLGISYGWCSYLLSVGKVCME